MFLAHLGARRQIALVLDTQASAQSFQTIFDTPQNAGLDAKIPHGDTIGALFEQMDVAAVQETLAQAAERLIDMKVLYPGRLLERYYTVAIDATGVLHFSKPHCPYCLTKTRNGVTTYYHNILTASIVTPSGLAIPLMVEFIENADSNPKDGEEKRKQDCELKAFYRLAPRLKQRFPRLELALLMDGLYAGGPVFEMCEGLGWKYIITLCENQLSTVTEEFHALTQMNPKNARMRELGGNDPIVQQFTWANDIQYLDSRGKCHRLDVLQCRETKPAKESAITFRWVSNFQVNYENAPKLANNGGRMRWKTENEVFYVLKNCGFELEHAYAQNENAAKIFLVMMMIAFILQQLIEQGSLLGNAFPKGFGSKKNLAAAIREALRRIVLTAKQFAQWLAQRIRIQFPHEPPKHTLAAKIHIPEYNSA